MRYTAGENFCTGIDFNVLENIENGQIAIKIKVNVENHSDTD